MQRPLVVGIRPEPGITPSGLTSFSPGTLLLIKNTYMFIPSPLTSLFLAIRFILGICHHILNRRTPLRLLWIHLTAAETSPHIAVEA